MPTLKLIGHDPVQINEAQARKIAEMKWGRNGGRPTATKDDPIELPFGTFQVSDVRAIFNNTEVGETKTFNNDEQLSVCKKRQEEVAKWNPLQKAERMLKTFCYLIYRAKGNEGKAEDVMFQDPLHSKLMKPLVEYFEQNPKEHSAPREVYERNIPSKFTESTDILGWKSINF